MDPEKIAVENEILDKLSGKIFLLQDFTHKRDVIFQVFLEVYNNSHQLQRFIRKSKGLEMEGFFKEFLSYGIIEEFLSDPEIEDIMINNLSPMYVRKTKSGLIKTDRRFSSREELDLFIKKLIIFSGRKTINKINNVELSEIKGRVNIVYSPFGPQITITRAKEKPLSIIELIKSGTLTPQLAAQLWIYSEGLGVKPANIIISGGPGTGKTTLLNALFSFIPEKERIVVIEDTLELNTGVEENCARLESDEETSLADLVKNALRMRPDRIIVGEVRGKEAEDLMTAMNIGKYCMGTLHASTARETIMRMENEPMNVPDVLVNLVDVFVIMRRYNIDGRIHRVVAELVETAGMEKKMVLLSTLWAYDLSGRQMHESNVSSIFRDRLVQISGKSAKDIMDETRVRGKLLELLLKKDITDIRRVTSLCRNFTVNRQAVMSELGIKKEDLGA
ncbi:MAG: ATPase, T2SS/T4P/T4SS family [Candidatus Omnitrophica bacterium]|nr:ATPase, T2SS/T4P/T4SS family [Candidatus Omnitrophota bacterium]MDD5552527.1 ATPase, T2SS/T4P/T4SS family [Candidatus Omnitrophota bacterium]